MLQAIYTLWYESSSPVSCKNVPFKPNGYKRAQPVSPRALSLVRKTFHRKFKKLTTPTLGPKKPVLVIAFRTALTLDVKLCSLAVRWLFVSTNSIKGQFLGVVGCKSPTLTVSKHSQQLIYELRLSNIRKF